MATMLSDFPRNPSAAMPPEIQRWYTELVAAVRLLQQHIYFGSGPPEGVVTAPQGAIYLRNNGAAGTTVYSKTTGGIVVATWTKTGWSALS